MSTPSSEIASEIHLKRQLVEATDAVRNKFKSLKSELTSNQMMLEKAYEPLTKPLKVITAAATAAVAKQNLMPAATPKSYSKPSTLTIAHPTYYSTPISSNEANAVATKPFKKHGESGNFSNSFQPLPSSPHNGGPKYTTLLETPPTSSSQISSSDITVYPSVDGTTASDLQGKIMEHLRNLKENNSNYDTTYGVHIDSKTGELKMGNMEIRFPADQIELWRGNKRSVAFPATTGLYDLIFMKHVPRTIDDRDKRIYTTLLEDRKS